MGIEATYLDIVKSLLQPPINPLSSLWYRSSTRLAQSVYMVSTFNLLAEHWSKANISTAVSELILDWVSRDINPAKIEWFIQVIIAKFTCFAIPGCITKNLYTPSRKILNVKLHGITGTAHIVIHCILQTLMKDFEGVWFGSSKNVVAPSCPYGPCTWSQQSFKRRVSNFSTKSVHKPD